MSTRYYTVVGSLNNTDILQNFTDLKSALKWCFSDKNENANFGVTRGKMKILSVKYKKPFHLIETPSKGTQKL